MQFKTITMAMLAAGSAMAHMNMKDPAPLEYKNNPNAKQPNIDYSITSPISAAQYPCKGYLNLLGTPDAAPVTTYAPGQQSTMSVEGGAAHNGGSCQLSLSYDKGASFTVIKSFIGNCPTSGGGTFGFTIPSDAPEGDDVVFAWTWVNKTGNREFYMDCAIVNIKAGGAKRDIIPNEKRATVAFAQRPQVFQANLGGKYCTKEGFDTVFPEPGPDVENNAANPGPAVLCATGENAPAGDAGSGSGSDSGSGPAPTSSSAPATTTSAPVLYVTSHSATSTSAQKSLSSKPATSSVLSKTTLISESSSATSSLASSDILTVIPVNTTKLTSSSSLPTGGGVFLTTGGAQPTTLSTAISAPASSSVPTSSSAPVSSAPASSSAAVPAPTTTTSASQPAPTGSAPTGGASGAQTGPCSQEGSWNCVDGASFQRCASGQWSVMMAMAAGTRCAPGISDIISMSRRRERVRRTW